MGGDLRIYRDDNRVTIEAGRTLIACYRMDPGEQLPFFYPVRTLTGEDVCALGTPDRYPHHRSIWIGHGNINGVSFWLNQVGEGVIKSERLRVSADGFQVWSLWQAPDGSLLMKDWRRFRFSLTPWGWLVECSLQLEAERDHLLLGKTNHAFFSARVRPELSVEGGGLIENSEGGRNEEGTMGKKARWCLYGRHLRGAFIGLALLDGPENPWHPSRWFTRNYGFLSPSPFNWSEWSVKRNEPLGLRYGAVVFHNEPDLNKVWDLFARR